MLSNYLLTWDDTKEKKYAFIYKSAIFSINTIKI
jgi:hypothetical protein